MSIYTGTKLVETTAPRLIAFVNESIVANFRNGVPAKINLPGIIDRAFLFFHEAAVTPLLDYKDTEGENG